MASFVKTRVKLPRTARAGAVVTVKTLVSHRMESGHRRGEDGALIPRSIIYRFVCAFNGETVVDVDLGSGVATNPYLEFEAIVPEAGIFTFTWFDDDGDIYRDSQSIAIL